MINQGEEKISDFSLKDACIYDAKLQGDEFVGLKYENGKVSVQFPLGYTKSEDEKEIRRDILNLISVLASFSDRKDSFIHASSAKDYSNQFPIHAYMYLISDFMNKGYYSESQALYKKSSSGKINWSRTIKQIRPQLIDDSVIYLDFIRKRTNHNENELISQIHKYLVYESFSKIGWIFSSFMPQKGALAFNANLFRAVVKSKISQTFDEKELMLFQNMLLIIDYKDSTDEAKNFYFGTEHFESVWEGLIDSVFGQDDKEKFYPKCHWFIEGKGQANLNNDIYKKYSLRPDTIMITNRGKENQKIFILDSKYYKYGLSKIPYDLPGTGSIVKQFAYAEFIEREPEKIPHDVKKVLDKKAIYNAFILPGQHDSPLQYFGYSHADYKNEHEKSYSKIYGFTYDIKTLMYKHIPKDKQMIDELAKLITTSL
ncbi:LlaJI family restriction endonuclease [Treponema sp.]|uniref:LlaJI family restriction endonuclease n=1 Tax=Treponema sp. TaxID=166 RepID=UPI0025E56072|nr:LlaJI family restriction endonuclease [Treponema sp.]MCR5218700.1 LlaJI family restriction endonuclease [Treponema sp.]